MAPRTLVPDKNTLLRWKEEGLTHQQMADRQFELTGERVTRTAISAAMVRYGFAKSGTRHRETVPWHVKVDHARAYPVRMLRLLSRKWKGDRLGETEGRSLESWLRSLEESQSIVAYDPNSDAGFFYIDVKFKDNDSPAPIRRKCIEVHEPTLRAT